jgi:hypothetical protein
MVISGRQGGDGWKEGRRRVTLELDREERVVAVPADLRRR